MMQSEEVNHGEKRQEVILRFVNGRLRLGDSTYVGSGILTCMATVYSDVDMGIAERSDVMIGYDADQQVWMTIRNDNDIFEWGSWENERKLTVLLYILSREGEYLLFCSNKDFFCYSAIPKKDPRQDRDGRISNTHMLASYRVLDELLRQTNQYYLKVLPTQLEGQKK